MGKLICTSECEECENGTLIEKNKACIKIKCSLKDKEYYYGQYVSCENKIKKKQVM